MKIKKICEICNREYFIYPCHIESRHTCSKECQKKYQSLYHVGKNSSNWRGGDIKNICEVCGKDYFTKRSISNNRHTCSKECKSKYMSAKLSGENNPKFNSVKKVCEICGNEYFVKVSDMDKRHTCSKECYSKYKSIYHIGKNNSNWKGGNIKKICEICGKEYFVYPSIIDRRFTCSKECGSKYQSLHSFGNSKSETMRLRLIEYNRGPLWYGNVTYNEGKQYCEKWSNNLRMRIREYYDNKSILSGKTKEDNNGKALSCHHVYYQKKACCIWDEDTKGYYAMIDGEKYYIKGDPNKFVTLTNDEHGKVSKDKLKWIKLFEDLIENEYGGKCYYTKEEYDLLNN